MPGGVRPTEMPARLKESFKENFGDQSPVSTSLFCADWKDWQRLALRMRMAKAKPDIGFPFLDSRFPFELRSRVYNYIFFDTAEPVSPEIVLFTTKCHGGHSMDGREDHNCARPDFEDGVQDPCYHNVLHQPDEWRIHSETSQWENLGLLFANRQVHNEFRSHLLRTAKWCFHDADGLFRFLKRGGVRAMSGIVRIALVGRGLLVEETLRGLALCANLATISITEQMEVFDSTSCISEDWRELRACLLAHPGHYDWISNMAEEDRKFTRFVKTTPLEVPEDTICAWLKRDTTIDLATRKRDILRADVEGQLDMRMSLAYQKGGSNEGGEQLDTKHLQGRAEHTTWLKLQRHCRHGSSDERYEGFRYVDQGADARGVRGFRSAQPTKHERRTREPLFGG